tara:strand:- start:159 stop:1004 length:846 start_codon:yes stop_codon:yes gene_type:complete
MKASFWMLGALLSFCLMAIAGRELSGALDSFEIMLWRSIAGIFIVLAIAWHFNTLNQIKFTDLKLHTIRNLCHFFGQSLWYFAVTKVTLAQLFAFEFTAPLWVALIAPLFLKESLTKYKFFNICLGFIGILIIARPESTGLSIGTLAAIFCAVGFAGSIITTKLLTRNHTVTCILFWLTVMQCMMSIICAGFDGNIAFPNTANLHWITIISVGGLTAHFCITTALMLAPASIVAPLEFLRLPLIAVVGYFFYGEALSSFVLVGAILIVGANLANLRKAEHN